MHKYRIVILVLLGLMAVSIRMIQPNAPFIWVGRSDVGSIVWTRGENTMPFDHQTPVPYLALGMPISLNFADALTLASIPGLGPVKSRALVQYRRTHGCFAQLKDIEGVRGIGPRTVLKVAPYLRIDMFDDRACASPLDG